MALIAIGRITKPTFIENIEAGSIGQLTAYPNIQQPEVLPSVEMMLADAITDVAEKTRIVGPNISVPSTHAQALKSGDAIRRAPCWGFQPSPDRN